jgi:hypothetical protein
MGADLYSLIALAARYWFCALMVLIVFRAWRVTVVDNRRAKILRAYSPETGGIGEFLVNIPGKRGARVPIPREGVLGSGGAADIRIAHKDIEKKHAYIEQREAGLLLRPIGGAKVAFGDGASGDQLLLRDGDIIEIKGVRMMLVLFDAVASTGSTDQTDPDDEGDLWLEDE